MPDKPSQPAPSLTGAVLRAVGSLLLVIIFSILLMVALGVGIGLVTGGLFGAGWVMSRLVPWIPAAILLIAPIILAYLFAVPFGGAYQPALMFRYLRRKLIPMFAILAVTLCVAMVIIVASVMGGFLELVRTSGKSLMGDVSMYAGHGGFPHYADIISELEQQPEVKAATPVIVGYGLIKLPAGSLALEADRTEPVQVYGIVGTGYDAVTEYSDQLYWTPERVKAHAILGGLFEPDDLSTMGLNMDAVYQVPLDGDESKATALPVIVPGIEISPRNQRTIQGEYRNTIPMPGLRLPLTLVPVSERGSLVEPSVRQFVVVNEFHSGLYEIDSNRVFIPFKDAQEMMLMNAVPLADPDDPFKIIGEKPARTTEIHVSAIDGVTPDELLPVVQAAYDRVADRRDGLPWMSIETWEQRQQQYLRAVENEKGMITMLFGIISFVAVVMVGVVFYMIVLDKTRDIGILRSLGASRSGIASIFLGYGMAVGVIGSAIGTIIAYYFVTYINDIHTWLGTDMPVHGFIAAGGVIGLLLGAIAAGIFTTLKSLPPRGARWTMIASPAALTVVGLAIAGGIVAADPDVSAVLNLFYGNAIDSSITLTQYLRANLTIVIWDKRVYFFDKIPNQVNPLEVTVFVVVAIGASIVGALLPAIKASRVHPVDALRYE